MKLRRNTPAERILFWFGLALCITVPSYQMGAWSCKPFNQDLYVVISLLMAFGLGGLFGFIAFSPVGEK